VNETITDKDEKLEVTAAKGNSGAETREKHNLYYQQKNGRNNRRCKQTNKQKKVIFWGILCKYGV